MRSRWLCEGVIETEVPGHTKTSPPRDRRRIAVSEPAVSDEPAARRLPASTNAPEPPVRGRAAGAVSGDGPGGRFGPAGGWPDVAVFPPVTSAFPLSGGLRRISRRLLTISQV